MKKFYEVNEKIFIGELKKSGIIKAINVEEKEVTVSYFNGKDDKGNPIYEKQNFKFWQINKYREPLKIKVKYFDKNMPKLEKTKIGSWVDLRAAEDVTLKQFDYYLIPLGVAIELPKNYEANIIPRSSTYKNFGIIQVNSFGQIDPQYNGDNDQWFMPVVALKDTKISKYDRIAQFRVNRVMPKVNFIEVEKLDNEDRNGVGSTGVK